MVSIILSLPQNKQLLFEWLGDVSDLDDEYCEAVKGVKRVLESGVNTPRNGHRFVESSDWSALCEKFVNLMRRAIVAHSGGNEGARNFKEAENDDDNSYGKHKIRRNQGRFRLNLIHLYGCRCAITGEALAEVVEAAHIVKHSQSGLNHTGNGILLRSDVHRLFDANLLGIDPHSLKITTASKLCGTEYAQLAGKNIRSRIDGSHPDHDNLQMKWEEAGFGE